MMGNECRGNSLILEIDHRLQVHLIWQLHLQIGEAFPNGEFCIKTSLTHTHTHTPLRVFSPESTRSLHLKKKSFNKSMSPVPITFKTLFLLL